MRFFLAFILLFAAAACDVNVNADLSPKRPDFRPALEAHLAAITAKDLDAYKPTVTADGDLMLVFPDGSTIDTTEGVISFHEEWFSDADWRMDSEVVKTIEGDDMAAALLKYDYRDTPEGEPRSAWLVLLFKLENGEWRLVHDQNTRITPQPESAGE